MSEMTRVRLLAIFAGPHGSGQVGDVRDLPAEVAAEFVDGGYAEYVEGEAEPAPEPAPAEDSVSEREAAPEEAPAEPTTAAEEAPSEPEAQAAPEESPTPVEVPAEAQGI